MRARRPLRRRQDVALADLQGAPIVPAVQLEQGEVPGQVAVKGRAAIVAGRASPSRKATPPSLSRVSKQTWAMLWLAWALPGYCASERSESRRDSAYRPTS